MKTTLDFSDFREAFRTYGRDSSYTREGLEMLFNYFEELESDLGEEIELDVIAICCDYSEDTLEDIVANYKIDLSDIDPEDDDYEEQCTESVRDYLENNTRLVGETATGFVYACF